MSKQPVSPIWFSSMSKIGQQMAEHPNCAKGEEFPIIVLSVPTGLFVVPETSCEIFNKEVNQALIVGSSEHGIKGAFE